MLPAYENSLFSLDLERIVFVYVIKKGCDSVVLHAVCPPPKVIRESLLETPSYDVTRRRRGSPTKIGRY